MSRSEAIAAVLEDLRRKDVLISLRGWRNECFNVYNDFGRDPLFRVERSAVSKYKIVF